MYSTSYKRENVIEFLSPRSCILKYPGSRCKKKRHHGPCQASGMMGGMNPMMNPMMMMMMQQMQQMQQKSQGTGGGGGGNSAGSKVESRPSAPEPDDDDAIDPDVQELCAPWKNSRFFLGSKKLMTRIPFRNDLETHPDKLALVESRWQVIHLYY